MNQTLSVSLGPQKRKHGPCTLIHHKEPPKTKKLQSNKQRIYNTLFLGQEDWNVVVTALGRMWHLHKLYLSQSPYFDYFFKGIWQKANEKSTWIEIEIDDDRITEDSLNAVFGSMYSDEIDVKVDNVIPIMATATFFRIDVIKERCVEVMLETISPETATQYYEAACRYDVVAVKQSAFQWFQFNLVRVFESRPDLLRLIPIELMLLLTASHGLQLPKEFDLYILLRSWMFLRLHPDYDPEDPERQAVALRKLHGKDNVGMKEYPNKSSIIGRKYFQVRPKLRSFLETPEGQPYVGIFQKLRTQYLTHDYMGVKELFSDNIVPKEWITMHITSDWISLLRKDYGPDDCNFEQVDDEKFFQTCMRYGRRLVEPERWFWEDYIYGITLALNLEGRSLKIKQCRNNRKERFFSLRSIYPIMIRVTVTSVDDDEQPVYTKRSEVRSIELVTDEYEPLLSLDPQQKFPMVVHFNLLFGVPPDQGFKESEPHMGTLMVPLISGEDVPEIEADGDWPLTPTPKVEDSANLAATQRVIRGAAAYHHVTSSR